MYAIMRGIELLEIYTFRDIADRICNQLNAELLNKNTYHVERIQDMPGYDLASTQDSN